MKNKTLYYISTPIFVAAELATLLCMLFAPHSEYSLYAAITVAFLYALLFNSTNAKVMIMQIALLFTLAANTFLVGVTTQVQWFAISALFICQTLYFARLLLELKSTKWIADNIAIRIILVAAAITSAVVLLKNKCDYVSIILLAYYVSIVHNAVLAFCMFKKSPMLAIGLLLLLFSQTITGLNIAIGTYINVPESSILYIISHTSFNLAWALYIPSQTFIALSVVDATKEKKNEDRTKEAK